MKAHTLFFIVLGISLFSGCKIFKNWFEKKGEIIKEPIDKNIVEITSKQDFEEKVLNSKIPAIVKFETKWCGACKTMKPIFQAAASQFKNKVKFNKIDADKLQDIAIKYDIKGVPTFLFFKNGKVVNTIVGGMSKDEFIKKVKDFLEKS